MKTLLTGLLLTAALPAFAADLTIWDWKSGDPAAAYFAKTKETFEAAHPGDTVTYVMQPNDQYYALLGTALASDGGPDLFLLNGGAQARARFENAMNLDGKLGDLQGNLAGLPEFSGATGLYAVPLTIQGFMVHTTKSCMPMRVLTPPCRPKPGTI